jgi:hypothetical protein
MLRPFIEQAPQPLAYRTRATAAALDVSEATVERWAAAGLLPYSKVGGCRLFEVDVIRAFLKRWRCGRPGDDVLAEALAGANHAIEETEELLSAFAAFDDDDGEEPAASEDEENAPAEPGDLEGFRREVIEKLASNGGYTFTRAIEELSSDPRYQGLDGIEETIRDITPHGFYFITQPCTRGIAAEFKDGEVVDTLFGGMPAKNQWAGLAPGGEVVEGTAAAVVVLTVYGRRAIPSEMTVTRPAKPRGRKPR